MPPSAASSSRAGALIGVGLMAAVDEIVFHQLLRWHHFFDRATPAWGIVSDGLLHAFEVLAVVGGFFWLLDLSRGGRLRRRWAWAGFWLGAGGFQLFDGLINHKVLGLHQVRYGVDLLVYDLVWNGAGLVLLGIGALVWRHARRRAGRRPSRYGR